MGYLTKEIYQQLAEGFCTAFGPAQPRFFLAPGRTELGGNHTDHQHGRVLAAAVELFAAGAAAATGNAVVRVCSRGMEPFAFSLDTLQPQTGERGSSAALVRGVLEYFTLQGWKIGGFDLYVDSYVPVGSGLSSSAAFEVLVAAVVSGLFNESAVSAEELAIAAQYAENVHFGKPCGLMDQMASAQGGVCVMDFRDSKAPEIRRMTVDLSSEGYALCMISAGGSHADLTEHYASIPNEMKQVAGWFGKEVLRQVEQGQFYDCLPLLREELPHRAILRAIHFFEENVRVLEQEQALQSGRIGDFLSLVRDSGKSSWTQLQNICVPESPNQPLALALAYSQYLLKDAGVCRVHGGGFAGTLQAYVPLDKAAYFISEMEKLTGPGSCQLLNFCEKGAGEVFLYD